MKKDTAPREREREEQSPDKVWKEYEKGVSFKTSLNLYETVKVNEDFFVGKQWEGVQANGLPTPVFNFIRRIVLFLVASTATDNLKINATPLSSTGEMGEAEMEKLCTVVNAQYEAIFEQTKMGKLIREFMRAAAVDGDACLYSWFDPGVETGQMAQGAIRTELLENTRVIFGNPNSREVQGQPYIIISRRELMRSVRDEMKRNGEDPDLARSDTDETNNRYDALADDGKVTTLTRFWKEGGTVWCIKTVQDGTVRKAWDTGMKLYPIAWMSWDHIPNCYHGQAAVTSLIPNQVFVNKLFAMTMISLMTTAYPKVVYDRVRIPRWEPGVGKPIPMNGGSGNVNDAVKVIDPGTVSPQVSQFIEMAISLTKELMGASDAALGNTKPDNTSAILAVQKASQVPMELIKQDLYQCLEDMGNIWIDQMRVYYGQRYVNIPLDRQQFMAAAKMGIQAEELPSLFDFGILERTPLSIKLDVGGSAYWSEIAQMNTLDNLLMSKQIDIVDYLERVPNGYISNQQELIDTLKDRQAAAMQQAPVQTPGGGSSPESELVEGYQTLARKSQQIGLE